MDYFSAACKTLRDSGYTVTPTGNWRLTLVQGPEIPGGAELTIQQVVDLACQQPPPLTDIQHQIAVASDRLSWRLTQQIESAYSRILAAGERRAAMLRLNGSCEYTDLDRFLRGQGVDAIGNVVAGPNGTWAISFTLDRDVPAGEPIAIGGLLAKQQFIRSAVWFWCLLFGHWEYYEGEKSA